MKLSRLEPLTAAGPRMARELRLARAGPPDRAAGQRPRQRTETAPDSITGGRVLGDERIVYPLVGRSLLAVDTTRVDLSKTSTLCPAPGDLGGGNPCVEPER